MKIKCTQCEKTFNKKPSRIKKFVKHFCSDKCWRENLITDSIFEQKKEWILGVYNKGKMLKDIAGEMNVKACTLGYRMRKWGIRTRRSYDYKEVLDVIAKIAKQKSIESKKNYLERYKNGHISWRHAHSIASELWGITKIPCQVCGWNKAERDMHLLIPRLLEKENAVSLCPNCHRLFHRKKLTKKDIRY